MTDIVERLRTELHGFKTAQDAATEVAQLRAENERLAVEIERLSAMLRAAEEHEW